MILHILSKISPHLWHSSFALIASAFSQTTYFEWILPLVTMAISALNYAADQNQDFEETFKHTKNLVLRDWSFLNEEDVSLGSRHTHDFQRLSVYQCISESLGSQESVSLTLLKQPEIQDLLQRLLKHADPQVHASVASVLSRSYSLKVILINLFLKNRFKCIRFPSKSFFSTNELVSRKCGIYARRNRISI